MDDDRWEILMHGPYDRTCRIVRKRIPGPIRSRFDAEDVVMDAILRMLSKGDRPPSCDLLILASKRNLIEQCRRQAARKRRYIGESLEGGLQVPDRNPGPHKLVESVEQLERFFDGFSGEERDILTLAADGYSARFIAGVVGWHERKVQRFLKRCKP